MPITDQSTYIAGLNAGFAPKFLKVGGTMEAAGVYHSLLYTSGFPGAAVAPTPGLAGAALTTYAGQIPFPAAVGGKNIHLSMFRARSTQIGSLSLVDRLWHNSGFTVTTLTAQTVNSAAFPARDRTGTINGVDVQVGIEVSTATTNAGAITNMTMSYTNEAGTAGRTATISSFPATAAAGTFVPFQLQAGDSGVRSIQSLTLGTSLVTGVVHLVAYRALAVELEFITANIPARLGPWDLNLLRCYDNSVPFLLFVGNAVTAATVAGQVGFAQN